MLYCGHGMSMVWSSRATENNTGGARHLLAFQGCIAVMCFPEPFFFPTPL